MTRRDIIKYTVLATGTAVAAPLMTTLFSGCNTDSVAKLPAYKPQFFSEEEFSILKKVIDIILPKTNSPSASELGVQNIIDTMVGTVYEEEDRLEYKAGFTSLLKYLGGNEEQPTKGAIPSLEKLQIINTAKDGIAQEVRDAFQQLKQQTVAYYLSTEEIGKNYLNYLPVPGNYEPCIKLTDVEGKAWAI